MSLNKNLTKILNRSWRMMFMMKKFCFAFGFLFSFMCHSVVGGSSLKEIPVNIETVISGGFWKEGNSEGYYRVVVKLEGWEYLANRMFLQWIEQKQETNHNVLIKTIPILEFSKAHWRIDSPKFDLEENEWVISFKASPAYGGEMLLFNLKPKGEFNYSLSNRKLQK